MFLSTLKYPPVLHYYGYDYDYARFALLVLLLGGMDSIVFGPIRWCVWSFRLSSPLRLPHLKFFCLFVSPFT